MPLADAIQSRLAASRGVDRSLNYGRPIIARFLREAALTAPAASSPPTIVDLGAGHGDDLDLAQQAYPQAHLHAVEAMNYHADLLTAKGFTVHRLDIERDRLPFADASVDAVIANQILEHTKDLFWILHEVARTLRPGGALIVGVPNLASLHNRLLLLLGRQPTSITIDSAHVRGFTRQGLARLLAAAAPGILTIERSAGANFYPFPAALARPLARILPGMAVSSFFLIRKRAPYAGEILRFVTESRFETSYFVGPAQPGPGPTRQSPWA